MLPEQRREAARQLLANPMFLHYLDGYIETSGKLAVYGESRKLRREHRYVHIWAVDFRKQIEEELKAKPSA